MVTANQNMEEELLEGEARDTERVYPNAEVRVEKAQYSIMHIKRLVEDRKELVLDPDFQRNKVWGTSQAAELVESILMGIPIPIIYLFEMRDGRKQVVDGRQRISAVLDFLNGKMVLKDLKILTQYNGCRFSDLDAKMQGVFEDYQFFFYIIQPPTPERVKYDIFDRVNRGGTKLNSQEMRNALYRGKATHLLAELSTSEAFLKATGRGISSKRMKDQYVILRAIAFCLLFEKNWELVQWNGESIVYKSDMDDFLAKMMVFLNEKASDDLLEWCRAMFLKAMRRCHEVMGEDAFRFEAVGMKKRPVNMPLFEIMMYIFALEDSKADRLKVLREVIEFKRTLDYEQILSGNVDSSINVGRRFEVARNFIEKINHL